MEPPRCPSFFCIIKIKSWHVYARFPPLDHSILSTWYNTHIQHMKHKICTCSWFFIILNWSHIHLHLTRILLAGCKKLHFLRGLRSSRAAQDLFTFSLTDSRPSTIKCLNWKEWEFRKFRGNMNLSRTGWFPLLVKTLNRPVFNFFFSLLELNVVNLDWNPGPLLPLFLGSNPFICTREQMLHGHTEGQFIKLSTAPYHASTVLCLLSLLWATLLGVWFLIKNVIQL